MVRIIHPADQEASRTQWLLELEKQAQEKRIQKDQERRQKREIAAADMDVFPIPQKDPSKEFGARRRSYQAILQLGQEYHPVSGMDDPSFLTSVDPTEVSHQTVNMLMRHQEAPVQKAQLPKNASVSHGMPPHPPAHIKHKTELFENRVPFTGAVKTHDISYNRQKSSLNFEDADAVRKEEEARKWKEALQLQIKEKQDRLNKEKERQRLLDLKEMQEAERMAHAVQMERSGPPKPIVAHTANAPPFSKKEEPRESSHHPQNQKEYHSKIPQLKHSNALPQIPLPVIEVKKHVNTEHVTVNKNQGMKRDVNIRKEPKVIKSEVESPKKEKQTHILMKPVQKFKLRRTPPSPPRMGRKEWPAGEKAAMARAPLEEKLPQIPTNKPAAATLPHIPTKKSNTSAVVKESVVEPEKHHVRAEKKLEKSVQMKNPDDHGGKLLVKQDSEETIERKAAMQELQKVWNDFLLQVE